MNSITKVNQLIKPAQRLRLDQTLLKNQFQSTLVLKANKSVVAAFFKSVTAASIIGSMNIYANLKKKSSGKETVKKELPKDTVIIYQFPRAAHTPSLSPFALKLESWCRMADIKYQNVLSMQRGNRGLIPFIKLNGYEISDSQLCINYLTKVFRKNLDAHLTTEQKAISDLLNGSFEELKWVMALHRFWHSNQNAKETGLPTLAYWFFSFRIYFAGWFSGYSRFSKEELYDIGKRNLKALDVLIGDKKYCFSNDRPSEIDAITFSMLAQFKYNELGPIHRFLETDCHNLVRYLDNFKATYWPDWDQNTGVGRRKLKAEKAASVVADSASQKSIKNLKAN